MNYINPSENKVVLNTSDVCGTVSFKSTTLLINKLKLKSKVLSLLLLMLVFVFDDALFKDFLLSKKDVFSYKSLFSASLPKLLFNKM